MAQKLYRSSAANTATLVLLIVFVGVNVLGYFGLQSGKCPGISSTDELRVWLEWIGLAAIALALYTLISFIKHKITLKSLPGQVPAAILAVLLSIAGQAIYFLGCERYI